MQLNTNECRNITDVCSLNYSTRQSLWWLPGLTGPRLATQVTNKNKRQTRKTDCPYKWCRYHSNTWNCRSPNFFQKPVTNFWHPESKERKPITMYSLFGRHQPWGARPEWCLAVPPHQVSGMLLTRFAVPITSPIIPGVDGPGRGNIVNHPQLLKSKHKLLHQLSRSHLGKQRTEPWANVHWEWFQRDHLGSPDPTGEDKRALKCGEEAPEGRLLLNAAWAQPGPDRWMLAACEHWVRIP